MIKSIVSFKQVPFRRIGDVRVADSIVLARRNDSDVFMRITPEFDKNKFEVSIDDDEFVNIGKNDFTIDKEQKIVTNGKMDVWAKKDRGKGFGYAYHLLNVMALMENNLEKIELKSLGEAVFFHGKCKFVPDLKDKDDIENVMYFVSTRDGDEFKEIAQEAGKILDKSMFSGYICTNFEKVKQEANKAALEYIEKVNQKKLHNDENYRFVSGFNMVLTKERILDNKDYFNELFKNCGIDYKIKDPHN